MRRALLLLLAIALGPEPAAAQNFQARLESELNQVQGLLGETFGRSVPLPSASAGVSYAFDPATGNFQRQPETSGRCTSTAPTRWARDG
jgi:hypothetical protein